MLRWWAKAWAGTAGAKRSNPGRFQLGALWRPTISAAIDHVSAWALLYSPHLQQRCQEVLDFIVYYFFLSLFREKYWEWEGRKDKGGGEKTAHTLIGKGFQPLLFHLSGFISALILDFLVHPSHIHKNWRFHSLGGQDYSNKTVS